MITFFKQTIRENDLCITLDPDSGHVDALYHVTEILDSSHIAGYESCNYIGEYEVEYAKKRWVTGVLFKYPECLNYFSEEQSERAKELYKRLRNSNLYKKQIRKNKFSSINEHIPKSES